MRKTIKTIITASAVAIMLLALILGVLNRIDRDREEQAKQIVHAFISEARDPTGNVTFEIGRDNVSYDPNVISGSYAICFVDRHPLGPIWDFGVRFEDGSYYYAEVWKREGNKWWLRRFILKPELSTATQ